MSGRDTTGKVRCIRYKYRRLNLCLLQQYKWSTIKIQLPRLIMNSPYASNVMTTLDFFISR